MKTTEKMDPLSLQCWLLAFEMLSFEGEIIHPKSTKRLTEAPGVLSVVGFTYLSVCASEMRWPSSEHDLLLNKNIYIPQHLEHI